MILFKKINKNIIQIVLLISLSYSAKASYADLTEDVLKKKISIIIDEIDKDTRTRVDGKSKHPLRSQWFRDLCLEKDDAYVASFKTHEALEFVHTHIKSKSINSDFDLKGLIKIFLANACFQEIGPYLLSNRTPMNPEEYIIWDEGKLTFLDEDIDFFRIIEHKNLSTDYIANFINGLCFKISYESSGKTLHRTYNGIDALMQTKKRLKYSNCFNYMMLIRETIDFYGNDLTNAKVTFKSEVFFNANISLKEYNKLFLVWTLRNPNTGMDNKDFPPDSDSFTLDAYVNMSKNELYMFPAFIHQAQVNFPLEDQCNTVALDREILLNIFKKECSLLDIQNAKTLRNNERALNAYVIYKFNKLISMFSIKNLLHKRMEFRAIIEEALDFRTNILPDESVSIYEPSQLEKISLEKQKPKKSRPLKKINPKKKKSAKPSVSVPLKSISVPLKIEEKAPITKQNVTTITKANTKAPKKKSRKKTKIKKSEQLVEKKENIIIEENFLGESEGGEKSSVEDKFEETNLFAAPGDVEEHYLSEHKGKEIEDEFEKINLFTIPSDFKEQPVDNHQESINKDIVPACDQRKEAFVTPWIDLLSHPHVNPSLVTVHRSVHPSASPVPLFMISNDILNIITSNAFKSKQSELENYFREKKVTYNDAIDIIENYTKRLTAELEMFDRMWLEACMYIDLLRGKASIHQNSELRENVHKKTIEVNSVLNTYHHICKLVPPLTISYPLKELLDKRNVKLLLKSIPFKTFTSELSCFHVLSIEMRILHEKLLSIRNSIISLI